MKEFLTNEQINQKIYKIKGWKKLTTSTIEPPTPGLEYYTDDNGKIHYSIDYSGNISSAWELVEEMIVNDNKFDLYRYGYGGKEPIIWEVSFGERWQNLLMFRRDAVASRAICLAWIAWKEPK